MIISNMMPMFSTVNNSKFTGIRTVESIKKIDNELDVTKEKKSLYQEVVEQHNLNKQNAFDLRANNKSFKNILEEKKKD